jgi:hypothetical protein
VDPIWQAAYSTIKFANESDRQKLPETDFRYLVPLFLQSFMLLCENAQQWRNKTAIIFHENRVISASALTRKLRITLAFEDLRISLNTMLK